MFTTPKAEIRLSSEQVTSLPAWGHWLISSRVSRQEKGKEMGKIQNQEKVDFNPVLAFAKWISLGQWLWPILAEEGAMEACLLDSSGHWKGQPISGSSTSLSNSGLQYSETLLRPFLSVYFNRRCEQWWTADLQPLSYAPGVFGCSCRISKQSGCSLVALMDGPLLHCMALFLNVVHLGLVCHRERSNRKTTKKLERESTRPLGPLFSCSQIWYQMFRHWKKRRGYKQTLNISRKLSLDLLPNTIWCSYNLLLA